MTYICFTYVVCFFYHCPGAQQLSWDVQVAVRFLCGKAVILCVAIKERPCILFINHTFNLIHNCHITFFQDVYHIIQSCT